MRDVVISGGGPVGLGLAIDLGQRGHAVSVIERNATPPRIPKGQNLTQRTMEHMQVWGVEDTIRAAKTIPTGVGLGGLTAYGSLLSGYHYDWFKRASVNQYYAATNERLPQYETETVLRDRLSNLPNVDLLTSCKTTRATQSRSGVEIEFDTDNGPQTMRAQYLVGCDGSRSCIRETAGITETVEDHDRPMVLIVFNSPQFFELIREFPDKQFYNVLHPDLDGYWMFFGMVEWGKSFFFHAPVPRGTQRDTFDFKGLIHRAVGREFDLELDYVGFWDLRISQADQYRKDRIFIAGDAAHSHPPYGGYGINTGFEDARNLGWKLSAALNGWAGDHLLESYQAERHPVFASTAHDFIDRFIRDDRAFVRAHDPTKNKAEFEAAWSARSSGGAARGIAGYAPHYGGSPIVVGAVELEPSAKGEHYFAARAGHHLPPPALGSDHRRTDGFQFLATDTPDIPSTPIPVRHVPMTAETAARYEAERILVRPDGFVAWCGAATSDVETVIKRAAGY